MGKQIAFYINSDIEESIYSFASSLGMGRYKHDGSVLFAFSDPGENWVEADVIQLSTIFNDSEARLWTGSNNKQFIASFELLRSYLKKLCKYDEDSSLWYSKEHEEEYKSYIERKRHELDNRLNQNLDELRRMQKP